MGNAKNKRTQYKSKWLLATKSCRSIKYNLCRVQTDCSQPAFRSACSRPVTARNRLLVGNVAMILMTVAPAIGHEPSSTNVRSWAVCTGLSGVPNDCDGREKDCAR